MIASLAEQFVSQQGRRLVEAHAHTLTHKDCTKFGLDLKSQVKEGDVPDLTLSPEMGMCL